MYLIYELSYINLGSNASHFAYRLKSIFLRHSKNQVFSCRRLGITREVSRYTALTDGLMIVVCVQKVVV
jgi:hypothetical protein